MADKNYRLNVIKDLITNERIESQEYLLERLQQKDILLTQATLSRDLKLLKVAKVADLNGYKYSIGGEVDNNSSRQSYITDINRGVISVTFSANIGVVKTQVGHANSVALAIDNLAIPGVLGTIAGDDTIFFVVEDNYNKDIIKDCLAGKFPAQEE